MNRVSTEEVLNKAYRLAYFLHQDKGMAIRIVAAATLKLNVAMAVQSKRLYYIPVGRFSRGELRRTNGIRNKALFSDLHLLQRLVYGESEPYERQKELAAQAGPPGVRANGDPVSEDDLLVYFIKHLVRITTKRNAFYVTLGVSRLLHNYSTLETMEVYNAVIGEPERVKDDYYYRSRKAVLMHEMYERFGQLIRASRQRRGEERFETQQSSNEQRSLVRQCLRLFTPWDTQCPVPPDFDPFKTVIARLTSKSGDDENRIEVNRIHAVLHPDCFAKLVAAFGYSPPEERMELPRFFLNQTDNQSPPRQRSAPADLSAEELAEINHMLAEQAGRRRRSPPSAVVRIMVDGVERGRFNPAEQSSLSFTAQADAETIEVKTTDTSGDLLLATHLMSSSAEEAHDGAPIVYSIRLEGGQELSLSIARRSHDGAADLLIQFGYQETDLRRAARLWWERFSLRGAILSPRYVVVAMVVIISVVSYLAYVRLTNRPPEISAVQTIPAAQDPPADPPNSKVTSPTPTRPPRSKVERSTAVKAPVVKEVPVQAGEEEAATRSASAVAAGVKLPEVKKIYIDLRADDLRHDLLQRLSSSGVVSATTNADDADASLKIVLSQKGDSQIEASARLVNARGVVLWPKTGARRYSGDASKVLSEVVKDLTAAINAARSER